MPEVRDHSEAGKSDLSMPEKEQQTHLDIDKAASNKKKFRYQ